MTYKLEIDIQARLGLEKLAKSEPKAFKKAQRFIEELREHPKTGLGHPEPLKGKPEGRWSREITKKQRSNNILKMKIRKGGLRGRLSLFFLASGRHPLSTVERGQGGEVSHIPPSAKNFSLAIHSVQRNFSIFAGIKHNERKRRWQYL